MRASLHIKSALKTSKTKIPLQNKKALQKKALLTVSAKEKEIEQNSNVFGQFMKQIEETLLTSTRESIIFPTTTTVLATPTAPSASATPTADIFKPTTVTNNEILWLLDYDNTLFPTSYVTHKYFTSPEIEFDAKQRESMQAEFKDLSMQVIRLLDFMLNRPLQNPNNPDKIFIVTNATKYWFEKTQIFTPLLFEYIMKAKANAASIEVVSAQNLYGHIYGPQAYTRWKSATFQNVFAQHFKAEATATSGYFRQIIGLGDTFIDKDAFFDACEDIDPSFGLKWITNNERASVKTFASFQESLKSLLTSLPKIIKQRCNSTWILDFNSVMFGVPEFEQRPFCLFDCDDDDKI